MTERLLVTPYGRAAVAELRAQVAERKQHDAMAPVTVLVPNHNAGVVARRHLAAGLTDEHPGVAGLFITTIDRLAERLAAHLLSPRPPAVRPIVASAWRTVLAEDPGMFAVIKDHPATVAALLRTHRELRTLDATVLSRVAESTPLAGDEVRLLTRATQRIDDEPILGAVRCGGGCARDDGASPTLRSRRVEPVAPKTSWIGSCHQGKISVDTNVEGGPCCRQPRVLHPPRYLRVVAIAGTRESRPCTVRLRDRPPVGEPP